LALQIITAEQRMAEKRGHKMVICGQSGVGKTTLARTLDPDKTLFIDLEAGDTAIKDFPIDVIRPNTWQECRDFVCYIGGVNPSLSREPYDHIHYERVMQEHGDEFHKKLGKYDTIFVDSITVAGRLCFQYCMSHADNIIERSGKVDTRSAYGMHGREMMAWLTHLQHIRDKNVILVGILDSKVDDYGRTNYELQIEGSKTARELPGIVDEVITMTVMGGTDGVQPYRAFVCQTLNEWGYPAKDRSGKLNVVEEPHLGKLIHKLNGSIEKKDLTFVDPQSQPTQKGEAQ
jgi:hypothetical protein